jgi:hypothetical protein
MNPIGLYRPRILKSPVSWNPPSCLKTLSERKSADCPTREPAYGVVDQTRAIAWARQRWRSHTYDVVDQTRAIAWARQHWRSYTYDQSKCRHNYEKPHDMFHAPFAFLSTHFLQPYTLKLRVCGIKSIPV